MTAPQIKLLPDPPAPTGINDFPLPPPAKVILTLPLADQVKIIEDKDIGIVKMKVEERLTHQQLEFKQQWVRVSSCTITPDTPFSQENTITVGVAMSVGLREDFSASLGLKIGSLIDIGAKLTVSLSAEVALAESVSTKKIFSAKTQARQASYIWWQLKSTYTVTGHRKVVIISNNREMLFKEEDFTNPLVNDEDVNISTQFPASVYADIMIRDLMI